MAMLIGDADCTTGRTGQVWSALSAPGGPGAKITDESDADYAVRSAKMKAMVYAFVSGIITEVVTNAVVAIPAAAVTGVATGAMAGGPGVPVTGQSAVNQGTIA